MSEPSDGPTGSDDGPGASGDGPGASGDGTAESDEAPDGPTDREVVETAAEAAEGVIFSYYRQSELRDFDVTATFEDGVLEVDVYVNPPEDDEQDADAVADEAARTAHDAVEALFADAE